MSDPDPELEIELELDPEETRVRRWRQEQLQAAGYSEFNAYRLSIVEGLDWRKAAATRAAGAPEDVCLDLYLDY